MPILQIEQTRSTPRVLFDIEKGLLVITGQSYPENALKFYEPIIKVLDVYLAEEGKDLKVELNIPYINTSSSKCLMIILERLQEAFKAQRGILLTWYVDPENESEQECAEEFKEDVSFPFHIIQAEAT